MTSFTADPVMPNGTYTIAAPPHRHFPNLPTFHAKLGTVGGERVVFFQDPSTKSFTRVGLWLEFSERILLDEALRNGTNDGIYDGYLVKVKNVSVTEWRAAIFADFLVRGWTKDRHGYAYGEGFRLSQQPRCAGCNEPLARVSDVNYGFHQACENEVPT